MRFREFLSTTRHVTEGEIIPTKTGIIHKSTDRYGGGTASTKYPEPGIDPRDLNSLDIAATARLDRSWGVKFPDKRKNRKKMVDESLDQPYKLIDWDDDGYSGEIKILAALPDGTYLEIDFKCCVDYRNII